MNGDVVVRLPDGFIIRVVQSYGNCPQYIHARDIVSGIGLSDRTRQANPVKLSDVLSDEDVSLLERSDTFFIATVSKRMTRQQVVLTYRTEEGSRDLSGLIILKC